MRKAGFALALALTATTQLTVLSNPAFAQGAVTRPPAEDNGPPAANNPKAADPEATESNRSKKTTGWVLVGVGGALGVTGIVLDIVGANAGHVAGANGDGNTDGSRFDLLFAGTACIVAGIVTGVYGGALIYSADHGGDTKASTPPTDDGKADGATKALVARLTSAPSFTVPVLTAKF